MKWNRQNKLRLYHFLLLRLEEQYDKEYNVKHTSERWDSWLDSFEIEKIIFKKDTDYENYVGRGFSMKIGETCELPNFCYASGDYLVIDDPWCQRGLRVSKELAEKFLVLDFSRTN